MHPGTYHRGNIRKLLKRFNTKKHFSKSRTTIITTRGSWSYNSRTEQPPKNLYLDSVYWVHLWLWVCTHTHIAGDSPGVRFSGYPFALTQLFGLGLHPNSINTGYPLTQRLVCACIPVCLTKSVLHTIYYTGTRVCTRKDRDRYAYLICFCVECHQ